MATSATGPSASTDGDAFDGLLGEPADAEKQAREEEATGPDIDKMDDSAGEEKTPPAVAEEAGERKQEQETTPERDVDTLIQQFAKEHGLDLNDPNQRKIAKRLADKEVHIQKLTAKAAAASEQPDYYAQYAKELEGGSGETTAAPKEESGEKRAPQTQPADTEGQVDAPEFVKLARSWKNLTEPYTALNQAYADGDFQKAAETDNGLHFQRTLAITVPIVEELVERRIKKLMAEDLGDFVPSARQAAQERKEDEAWDHAKSSLLKHEDFKELAPKLFKAEEGPEIEIAGEKVENSPLNRILKQFPRLLNIKQEHKDPDKARKLTFYSILLEAANIYKEFEKKGIPPEKAKELMDAGAKIQEREEQGRVRQGLNAGAGSTGLAKGKPQQSWAEQVAGSAGDEKSVRTLFE
jgi:hypothetical protein